MLEALEQFFASVPRELYVFIISMLPIVELRGAIPVGAALGMPFYTNYPLSVLGNLLPVPFILLFIPRILNFMARFKIFRPVVEWLHRKAHKNSAKVLGKGEADKNAKPIADANTAQRAEVSADCGAMNTEAISADGDMMQCDEATVNNPTADAIYDTTAEKYSASADDTKPKKQKTKMSLPIFFGLMLFVAIPLPATGAWTGSLVAALFDLPKRYSFLAVVCGVLISGAIMSLASYGVLGFLSFIL